MANIRSPGANAKNRSRAPKGTPVARAALGLGSAHDRIFLLALAVLAVLHRAAWARYPSDVDPVNFVTALGAWDVTRNAPHPPGYPLFVAIADVAALIAPGVRAYEIVNLSLVLGGSTILYAVLRRRDSEVAFGAALLLAAHPLFWAATVTSESYGVDAFLGVTVLAVALATRHTKLWVKFIALFLAYAACAFTRPVSAMLLLPLGAVAASYRPERADYRAGAVAVSAAISAAGVGYLGTAMLAGGLSSYREAVDACMGVAFRETSLLGGAPPAAHAAMVAKMVAWFALLAAPAAIMLALARRDLPQRWRREAAWIGAAWALGPLLFYATVYYLKPTYHLIELPAILVATALGLSVLARGLPPHLRLVPVVTVAAAQLAFFWWGPAELPEPLRRLTRGHFERVDSAWEALAPRVRALGTERSLVIYRAHPDLPFRALQLMLPDRTHAALAADSSMITFFDPMQRLFGPSTRTVPASVERVIVVDAVGARAVLRVAQLDALASRSVPDVLRAATREEPIDP